MEMSSRFSQNFGGFIMYRGAVPHRAHNVIMSSIFKIQTNSSRNREVTAFYKKGLYYFLKFFILPVKKDKYLPAQWATWITAKIFKVCLQKLFFLLLTHEGSYRAVYKEFQPSHDIFRRWCQGLFRPQALCTPSLHCPIASSAPTQSQQPKEEANQI